MCNIVFIGNNIRYKGINDYYALAKSFQDITFHIVGGGIEYNVAEEIEKREFEELCLSWLNESCSNSRITQ